MIRQLQTTGLTLILMAASGCLAPTAEVLGPGATTAATTGGAVPEGAPDAGAEDAGSPIANAAADAGPAPDSGVPAPPAIRCSPTGLDFGLNAVGIASTLNVLCTNVAPNSSNLIIGDASSSGLSFQYADQAFSASFDQPFPVGGLAPGEIMVIDVTYAPSAGGTDTDTLIISSNDPLGPDIQISLTGGAKVLPVCEFSVQPTRVDLGDIARGVEVTFPLDIINTGEDECLINGLALVNFPGPLACNAFGLPDYPPGSSASVIIPPRGTLEIRVRLILTVPGPWAGEIDLSISPWKIPVTANVL